MKMDIYTIPYHDKYIVYRPLKRLAFVANAALVNLIVQVKDDPRALPPNNDQEAFEFLETIGFWEPEPSPPSSPLRNDPFTPTIAVLFLTTACNFRCIYCYAFGGETPLQTLPFELGCRAIDVVHHHAQQKGQDHFELSFHGGGEPTLARDNLRRLVAYATMPVSRSMAFPKSRIASVRWHPVKGLAMGCWKPSGLWINGNFLMASA
jgi:uncharacterized protein